VETETGYDLSAILSQPRAPEVPSEPQEDTSLGVPGVLSDEERGDDARHQSEPAVPVDEEIPPLPVVTAPGFAASDIYGESVELAEYRGQVVMLTIVKLEQGTDEDEEKEQERRAFYGDHRELGLEAIHVMYKSGFLPVTKSYVESRIRERHEELGDEWAVIVDWAASIKRLYQVDDSLLLILDKTGAICYAKESDLRIDDEARKVILELLGQPASSTTSETNEESG